MGATGFPAHGVSACPGVASFPAPHSTLSEDCHGNRIPLPAALSCSIRRIRGNSTNFRTLRGGFGGIQRHERSPRQHLCLLSGATCRLAPVRWASLGRPHAYLTGAARRAKGSPAPTMRARRRHSANRRLPFRGEPYVGDCLRIWRTCGNVACRDIWLARTCATEASRRQRSEDILDIKR